MGLAALVRRMTEAGASGEAIALAVEAVEAVMADVEDRRRRDRERKRAKRESAQNVHGTSAEIPCDVRGPSEDKTLSLPIPKEMPPQTPPKEITLTPPTPSSSLRSEESCAAEFSETFWPEYPHKVGKPDALKSFQRARRKHPLDAIMQGLRGYLARKSADTPWLNPSTFLNQERFLDEPAQVGTPRLAFSNPGQGPPAPYVSPYAVPKGPELSREEQLEAARKFDEDWQARKSR